MEGPDPIEPDRGYLLDNRAAEAELRFDSLSALFNPMTFGHLDVLGVGSGWQCWEVGVGGPSIPAWLSARVGNSGRVLATDIDLRWVGDAAPPNVETRRHDIARDPPPEGPFELVHERLVLIHVPERVRALEQMVSVLRPGGWALVQDFDSLMQPSGSLDATQPLHALANRMRAGLRSLLAERGADLALGRRLTGMLRGVGLVDVAADAFMVIGSPTVLEMEKANVRQVGPALIEGGHVSDQELEDYLWALDAGELELATPLMISAWGRRP